MQSVKELVQQVEQFTNQTMKADVLFKELADIVDPSGNGWDNRKHVAFLACLLYLLARKEGQPIEQAEEIAQLVVTKQAVLLHRQCLAVSSGFTSAIGRKQSSASKQELVI